MNALQWDAGTWAFVGLWALLVLGAVVGVIWDQGRGWGK